MRHGNLFVISGPSGAGKGTLVGRVVSLVPDAWVSVSATTRAPRAGEVDGVHYFFMDEASFDEAIEADKFLEWAPVHSHKYGTLLGTVEDAIEQGKQVILEIDVQGAFQVKRQKPDAHLIFIEPPSLEILEERLRGRGTETEDVISARMRVAEVELSRKMEYDIQLVNDNLDVATAQLVDYINTMAEK